MFIKRFAVVVLSLTVALVSILAACAAPAPTSTPTLTTTPIPTAAPTGPLAQVIAGAKKEGTVTLHVVTALGPKAMERLRKEIKERFGVDLDIKFAATGNMPKDLATAIMEYQAGATPTYDLMTFSNHVVPANQAGILEQVDWKPLLLEGTTPEVVMEVPAYRGGIINYTSYLGLMYNPDKVRASELPQTMSDLADPKWKGKIGIHNYTNSWARYAYIVGKEKTFSDLQAILKNKAMAGAYVDLYNRYLLGEISLCLTISSYLDKAEQKGVPASFQGLEFADVREYFVVVRKGAAHPNAAKLVAVYLASPAGVKLMLEEGRYGNLFYPGNFEHDIRAQINRQGIPQFSSARSPEITAFELSEEFVQWQKEIDLIFKTGG